MAEDKPINENFDFSITDGAPVESQYGNLVVPNLGPLPEYFESFISQVKDELYQALKNTVSTLKWYFDRQGIHNPLRQHSFRVVL